jgi:hypothetical protein
MLKEVQEPIVPIFIFTEQQINPKKNKIMIVFSYVENYMGLLYSLFGSWN